MSIDSPGKRCLTVACNVCGAVGPAVWYLLAPSVDTWGNWVSSYRCTHCGHGLLAIPTVGGPAEEVAAVERELVMREDNPGLKSRRFRDYPTWESLMRVRQQLLDLLYERCPDWARLHR